MPLQVGTLPEQPPHSLRSNKALEKDRTRRYGSPQDLAADIERYLTDQTIDVITSTTGVTHTFVWDSASDIPSSIQPTVIFRITAIDDGGLSSEKLTGAFSVDNR